MTKQKRKRTRYPSVVERNLRENPLPTRRRGEKLSTFKLIAEGDSWFDYSVMGYDLIDFLTHRHGHEIVNLSRAGSLLNDIAYQSSSGLSRLTELVIAIEREDPQALLLSAGGNDVALNQQFFTFLNHNYSNLEKVNEKVLEGVINETFKEAYKNIIACARWFRKDLPIFVHGYDYPFPDGRQAVVVGPWFDPAFTKKGYSYTSEFELNQRRKLLRKFIDKFYKMLNSLDVIVVDCRGTLTDRIKHWGNEMHPNNQGFLMLSDVFNRSLQKYLNPM